jgi:hypothetical protein
VSQTLKQEEKKKKGIRKREKGKRKNQQKKGKRNMWSWLETKEPVPSPMERVTTSMRRVKRKNECEYPPLSLYVQTGSTPKRLSRHLWGKFIPVQDGEDVHGNPIISAIYIDNRGQVYTEKDDMSQSVIDEIEENQNEIMDDDDDEEDDEDEDDEDEEKDDGEEAVQLNPLQRFIYSMMESDTSATYESDDEYEDVPENDEDDEFLQQIRDREEDDDYIPGQESEDDEDDDDEYDDTASDQSEANF